jgi:hypothetical protein
VPPGHLVKELKAGRDVILDDGTLVKAADVAKASEPDPVMVTKVIHLKSYSWGQSHEFTTEAEENVFVHKTH